MSPPPRNADDSVTVIMAGPPVAWARTRPQAKTGILFTPTRQRNAAATFRMLAQAAMNGRAPLEGPLAIELTAVFAIPGSWSKRRQAAALWSPKRPDLDNILKQSQDAGNGILWGDDAQISAAFVQKIYGPAPRLELTVRRLEPD